MTQACSDAVSSRRTKPTMVVLRALGLGDILTGVPALRALAEAYPDHHRILVAPETFSPLVLPEGLADEVHDHYGLDPLCPCLEMPDIAVDLHGRGPGSQPLLLALHPRRLIAFAHPDIPATAGGPEWRPGEQETARWCRMLTESGVPSSPERLDLQIPVGPRPAEAIGATVIHPGAMSAARRWPAERFASVARKERLQGRRVVVTGTLAERPLAAHVTALAGLDQHDNLAGRTDIATFARVIAGAGRVVCGDTGAAHLATAVGTPSVVLFGPVPPSEWGPPEERRDRHVVLWHGHQGDPHGNQPDPGLLSISVEEVETALEQISVAGQSKRSRDMTSISPTDPRLHASSLSHLGHLHSALRDFEEQTIRLEAWGEQLAFRLGNGARLLTVGNGGSAAHAEHLATELVGRYCDERQPFSALPLHVGGTCVSAISNDYGSDQVFSRQVLAHARRGDVLVAFSTSGRSQNVIAAVEVAATLGVSTWALTGPTPNPLADAADDAIAVTTRQTPTVQEVHQVAIHLLCEAFDRIILSAECKGSA